MLYLWLFRTWRPCLIRRYGQLGFAFVNYAFFVAATAVVPAVQVLSVKADCATYIHRSALSFSADFGVACDAGDSNSERGKFRSC